MQPVLDKFPEGRVISFPLDSAHSLFPDDYEIIPISDVDSAVSGVFIMISTKENIVFSGFDGKAIHLVDAQSGVVMKTLKTVGKGPGEFEHIGSLAFDGQHLVALDMGAQKILRFTSSLEFVDEHIISGLHVFSTIAYSSGKLLFSSRSDSVNLYKVHDLAGSKDPSSFHRYIINHSYQPRIYNNHFISVSGSGVSLLNVYLPLLFSYNLDDLNSPPTILRFVGDEMEKDNSEDMMAFPGGAFNLPPIEIHPDSSVGASPLFGGIAQMDEKIFFKQNSPNYLVYIQRKDSKYVYKGRFEIIDKNGESFTWTSMTIQPPWVYLGGSAQNQLVRLNLEVLERK